MRLIEHGKICSVNAKEKSRLQKWQESKKRKKAKAKSKE